MSGIYIHIPFCKTKCIYCDFFSNVRLDQKDRYVQALCDEIEIRKEYLGNDPVRTIYFGGGTPSLLNQSDFDRIFDKLNDTFDLSQASEITIEANPDDLSPQYIATLASLPFNRISMGIQSFSDDDLRFLNRRHSAEAAIRAVKECQANGFGNISIDLMYGLPNQTLSDWEKNLETALSLQINHISSYHLIYEEGTKLYRLLESGKLSETDEKISLEMFRMLIRKLVDGGFIHYEISNVGKEGYFSKHNSSYWKGEKYIGLGPGAHSFNLKTRSSNLPDLNKYINKEAKPITEVLTDDEQYNDFILTSLRTMWGISLTDLKERFGSRLFDYCMKQATPYLNRGMLIKQENRLKLSPDGIFISDGIMSDLMFVD